MTALSILWSQPISGLQIRGYDDNNWQWVKHIENALVSVFHQTEHLGLRILFALIHVNLFAGWVCKVVNGGDTLSMITGGYFKSAIHRVVQPPPGTTFLLNSLIPTIH